MLASFGLGGKGIGREIISLSGEIYWMIFLFLKVGNQVRWYKVNFLY